MIRSSAVALSFLVAGLLAQPMSKPPALPVITSKILPGEGWVPGTYVAQAPLKVFDTWKPARHLISTLPRGASYTLITGLVEVVRPDVISVTALIPELGLTAGEKILRYAERGEGGADFWAAGAWRTGDLGFVKNADGSGCGGGPACKAVEIRRGVKNWWFEIRLADGGTGWMTDLHSLNPNN